ncbi:MAG: flagellar basal body P-ring formation protein FlgA [Hyphomicrobiales bacterium]|nr:flagellar basal body P-ring formation protein FlgA [Hyphomicrobiales bacterium]
MRLSAITLALVGAATMDASSVAARGRVLVPVATIYPGEVVRPDQLREADSAGDGDAYVSSLDDIKGKVARRTLLAGKPIQRGWTDAPIDVANGAAVTLVYEQPGLVIRTVGQALQSGRVGDSIRARNSDSGLVVLGIVRADLSIWIAR